MAKKKEKPLTREDVLKAIEKNGGTAKGLDLSGKELEEGIDLSSLDLEGIILKEAVLWGAHLERTNLSNAQLRETDLSRAHLEESRLWTANLENAELWNAHLERSTLWGVDFKGARLSGAHLEGAILRLAKFSTDTDLADVDWGNYILGEENLAEFRLATETYRRLKVWHANLGMHDTAAKFYYREMTVRRKGFWIGEEPRKPLRELLHPLKPKEIMAALLPKRPFHWAWSMLLNLLCGYGERLKRILIWIPAIVFGFAAAYHFWGSFDASSFLDTLYYSAASFTALGYGQWAPQPTGWAKYVGAAEAFTGVFMMALLLVTFVRKMTR